MYDYVRHEGDPAILGPIKVLEHLTKLFSLLKPFLRVWQLRIEENCVNDGSELLREELQARFRPAFGPMKFPNILGSRKKKAAAFTLTRISHGSILGTGYF